MSNSEFIEVGPKKQTTTAVMPLPTVLVYVLSRGVDNEYCTVIGVYSTEQAAVRAALVLHKCAGGDVLFNNFPDGYFRASADDRSFYLIQAFQVQE